VHLIDEQRLTFGRATLDPVRHLFADERGSIVAVADANAIARNSYDEYGIPAVPNLGRFQYTGITVTVHFLTSIGRPVGDAAFLECLEAASGRALRHGKPGRRQLNALSP